jgi:DoxX-like family
MVIAVAVAVTITTALLNGWAAVADWVRARFVVANATAVGVPLSWLPALGAAKAAGAVGLVAGLAGLRPLGIAAATGLVLFFVGAVALHVRAGAYRSIVFPAAFLTLAAASLALALLP